MCLITSQRTVRTPFATSAGLLHVCSHISFRHVITCWRCLFVKGALVLSSGGPVYGVAKFVEPLWCADEADIANGATSDDSFTTDDEESAAVSGKQMWTMSFEWQDESVADTTDTSTSFEESTDFGRPSLPSNRKSLTPSTTDSASEAAEPSPIDPDRDWVQPWSDNPAGTAACRGDQKQSYPSSTEQIPKPKVEPMSDEHKTAILGKSLARVCSCDLEPLCLFAIWYMLRGGHQCLAWIVLCL